MAGIDNGTLQSSIFAQIKQFGSILRGFGPPVPQAGVVGDLYLDVQTWFLYGKRDAQATSPWGQYLYVVPAMYRNALKWFSSYLPRNDVGVDGDYCLLWGGFNNYGLQPSIFGPKVDGCWPESGDGPDLMLDPTYVGYELPAGLSDEGSPVAYSASSQLIVTGLSDEYILAIPVLQTPNMSVYQEGLLSPPLNIAVDLNPLYAAVDQHIV